MKLILICIFLLTSACEQRVIDKIANKQNKNMVYPVVVLEKKYNGRFYEYKVEDCTHNIFYIGKIKNEYNVGQTIDKR